MVQAAEAPTVEQLTEERNKAQSAMDGLNKALANAVRAFEKSVKDGADTEAILDFGDKVRAAKAAVATGEGAVTKAVSRIEFAEWQINSRDLTEATSRIYAGLQNMVAAELATLERFGATQVNGSVVLSGEAVGGVKAIVDRIPKAPSKGRSNGSRTATGPLGKAIVGGVEYSSINAAYRTLRAAADGCTPAELPPNNGKGARAWLDKNAGGFTLVS